MLFLPFHDGLLNTMRHSPSLLCVFLACKILAQSMYGMDVWVSWVCR